MKEKPVKSISQIKLMKNKRSPIMPTKVITPKKGKGSYNRKGKWE